MNMPGFVAERSLGPARGVYRGRAAVVGSAGAGGGPEAPAEGSARPALGRGDASAIRPALKRAQSCTTNYTGFVTFPIDVCRPRFNPPFPGTGTGTADPNARTARAAPVQSWSSSLPTIGGTRTVSLPSVCQTLHGPWLAVVVQEQSCDTEIPDGFTLAISGAPHPVELTWSGTLQDAPDSVGALGNLIPNLPVCSCCPGRKQCLDGSCVPLSSPCGSPVPA